MRSSDVVGGGGGSRVRDGHGAEEEDADAWGLAISERKEENAGTAGN